MTNEDIEHRLHVLIKEDRLRTAEMVSLIREADRRRLYLKRGFPSLFEWIVQTYGISHSAAYRRVQAAKLQQEVPSISSKIQNGEVNLTTLSQLQTVFNRAERKGHEISTKEKINWVEKIQNKSSQEVGRILSSGFPESSQPPDMLRPINDSDSRLTITIDAETVSLLNEIKQLIAHTHPGASWGEIVKYAATQCVNARPGSVTRLAAAPAAHGDKPLSKRALRQQILARGCEYRDEETGRVCGARYQAQVDHIRPRSLGGTDDPANLRCLCRKHNMLLAEKILGKNLMDKYWSPDG